MPSRRAFDPYNANVHETTKTARRNYLKRQALNLGDHPDKVRERKRLFEASQRATELRDQEKKKAQQKEKRLQREREKERREKEAKEKLVRQGKLAPDALLGKISASQQRLSTFLIGGAKKLLHFEDNKVEEEEEQNLETDPEDEVGLSQKNLEDGALSQGLRRTDSKDPAAISETEIEALLASFSSTQEGPESEERRETLAMSTPEPVAQPSPEKMPTPSKARSTQEEIDAQLSSEAQYEFSFDIDVFEDAAAQSCTPPASPSPSPVTGSSRKRKVDELDEEITSASPSKRLALSQMSPSKVNVRAKEKPDPLSTWKSEPSTSSDYFTGLNTQDLEFDIEEQGEASDKENTLPSLPSLSIDKGPAKIAESSKRSPRSVSNSFEAALRNISSSPRKPKDDDDTETDYGDMSDVEDSLEADDFVDHDNSWIDKAVLDDLPPTPSKSRISKPIRVPDRNNHLPAFPPQRPPSDALNTSFSALDDADFLEAAQAMEQAASARATPRPKKGRRIPWKDSSQRAQKKTQTPADADFLDTEQDWEALEILAEAYGVNE